VVSGDPSEEVVRGEALGVTGNHGEAEIREESKA